MYKIAIVGAGPAGIAMARELTAAGVSAEEILMFEKSQHDNASVRQFYPAGKTINSVYKNIETEKKGLVGFQGIIQVDDYFKLSDQALNESQVEIRFNTEVLKIKKQSTHFVLETSKGNFESEYVILASGVFAKPRKPDYKIPAEILNKVSYDVLRFQKEEISGKKIIVVGGGDSAAEYAQTLAALGNFVYVSYRQDNFFRMNQLNKDLLSQLEQKQKIKIMFSTDIVGLEAQNDKVLVKFEGHDDVIVDNIVFALGGASPVAFMNNCGIDYNDTNVQLRSYHESPIDRMFIAGDLSMGRKGGSLMLAFNSARDIMEGLSINYSFPAPAQV